MGSPLSLSRSVSLGVVSCRERYLDVQPRLPTGEPTGLFNTWIQTDAAINPGNSGGPLVDLRGEVVGINARMAGMAENIGFAIPLNVVREVADAIGAHGRMRRASVGLKFQARDPLGDLLEPGAGGVVIQSVDKGSPAARAGLRARDLLVAYDGRPVSARFAEELPGVYRTIARTPIGKEVPLSVRRGPRTVDVRVRTEELGSSRVANTDCPAWGCTFQSLPAGTPLATMLADTKGVIVSGVRPGGPADAGGLRAGMVVVSVDGESTQTLEELRKRYAEARRRPRVMLKAKLAYGYKYVLLKLR
jgi:serine protease Do